MAVQKEGAVDTILQLRLVALALLILALIGVGTPPKATAQSGLGTYRPYVEALFHNKPSRICKGTEYKILAAPFKDFGLAFLPVFVTNSPVSVLGASHGRVRV